MFQRIVQQASALGVGAAVSIAAIGAFQQAQAATFTYTSTLTVTANSFPGTSIATGSATYTKTDLPASQVGYKVTAANLVALGTDYTLADLISNPAPAQLINGFLPTKYQGILPNILSNATYDYVGDGGFPPSNATYAFDATEVAAAIAQAQPYVATLSPSQQVFFNSAAGLFAQGGTVSFSSQLVASQPDPVPPTVVLPDVNVTGAAAVPEPLTLAGTAIAGIGAVVARRRSRRAA